MLIVIAVLFILCICTLFSGYNGWFKKEKVLPLKAILAILIVTGHLFFYVNNRTVLYPFSVFLTPAVSLFFFISGYGLIKSYLVKGELYLKGFILKRVWGVLCPFLIALIFYFMVLNQPADYWRMIPHLIEPLYLPFSWYVFAIIYLYISYYMVFKYIPGAYRLYVLLLMTIIYIVVTKGRGYAWYWYMSVLAFPAGTFYAIYEPLLSKLWKSRKLYFFLL